MDGIRGNINWFATAEETLGTHRPPTKVVGKPRKSFHEGRLMSRRTVAFFFHEFVPIEPSRLCRHPSIRTGYHAAFCASVTVHLRRSRR